MARYFDPANDTDDKDLLHPDVRNHDELAQVAEESEEDVLDEYRVYTTELEEGFFATEQAGNDFEVALAEYESDPADAPDFFVRQLKRTIRDVCQHRLRNLNEKGEITSESLGDHSFDRSSDFDPKWPNGWNRRLDQFDLRERSTYI